MKLTALTVLSLAVLASAQLPLRCAGPEIFEADVTIVSVLRPAAAERRAPNGSLLSSHAAADASLPSQFDPNARFFEGVKGPYWFEAKYAYDKTRLATWTRGAGCARAAARAAAGAALVLLLAPRSCCCSRCCSCCSCCSVRSRCCCSPFCRRCR